jgi:predicted SAM-dependent methyltransferase
VAGNVSEPLRLHIGGTERKDGWKIFNIQPGPDVDFVGNCTDLGRFAEGSVAEIYASQVLEHLGYQEELPRALSEFRRVLRPGGLAMLSVPDFEAICRLFGDPRATHADRILLMRMAFGGQLDRFDFHYVGLTQDFLTEFLARAGFARFERVQRFGLFNDSSYQEVLGEAVCLNLRVYR